MDELGLLRKKIASQEKRIKKLERAVYDDVWEDEVEEEVKVVSAEVKKSKENVSTEPSNPISFSQVITVLGVIGVSIGVIFFFFYAIARGWIGETLQVVLGVLLGFVLFAVAFAVREKKEDWSNVVFGGAYFLEYLSIGVGVAVYEIMPAEVGVLFGALILISSVALCFKFSSRAIAYFSLVGGFLIPIITDTFESHLFVMVWYFLIVMALSVVSVSNDWGELRALMLFLITIFMWATFGSGEKAIEFLFLGLYFFMFNVAALINSVSVSKEINGVDSLILGILPFVVLPLIPHISSDSNNVQLFGLVVIVFSFIYLLEAAYLKSRDLKFPATLYSLIAAGVTTLNVGIYFLFKDVFGLEFFIIFFIVEWALFSYLSSEAKDSFYRAFSFVFLGLVAYWYAYILRFRTDGYYATFFVLVLAMVPLISFLYFRNNINYKASAATFIVSGFLLLLSFSKALWFVFRGYSSADMICEIILSVLWLIYTLGLYVQVQTKEGKILVGLLLGITLVKIAFKDLFFLEGALRIVGFIVFGILLLIGGYFLNNEEKK